MIVKYLERESVGSALPNFRIECEDESVGLMAASGLLALAAEVPDAEYELSELLTPLSEGEIPGEFSRMLLSLASGRHIQKLVGPYELITQRQEKLAELVAGGKITAVQAMQEVEALFSAVGDNVEIVGNTGIVSQVVSEFDETDEQRQKPTVIKPTFYTIDQESPVEDLLSLGISKPDAEVIAGRECDSWWLMYPAAMTGSSYRLQVDVSDKPYYIFGHSESESSDHYEGLLRMSPGLEGSPALVYQD